MCLPYSVEVGCTKYGRQVVRKQQCAGSLMRSIIVIHWWWMTASQSYKRNSIQFSQEASQLKKNSFSTKDLTLDQCLSRAVAPRLRKVETTGKVGRATVLKREFFQLNIFSAVKLSFRGTSIEFTLQLWITFEYMPIIPFIRCTQQLFGKQLLLISIYWY